MKAPLHFKRLPAWALALTLLVLLSAPRPLRLHVIAQSNSIEDQTVKLRVRDAILETMNGLGTPASAAQARQLVLTHGEALEQAANAVLSEAGLPYKAKLYLGKSAFPDRSYGGRFYPAGTYQALRVVLGSGQGQNWWCVIYPPLCLGELDEKELSGRVEFRSFFAELFQKLFAQKGGSHT